MPLSIIADTMARGMHPGPRNTGCGDHQMHSHASRRGRCAGGEQEQRQSAHRAPRAGAEDAESHREIDRPQGLPGVRNSAGPERACRGGRAPLRAPGTSRPTSHCTLVPPHPPLHEPTRGGGEDKAAAVTPCGRLSAVPDPRQDPARLSLAQLGTRRPGV